MQAIVLGVVGEMLETPEMWIKSFGAIGRQLADPSAVTLILC